MKLDLLTKVTSELLEQFGAGNHKPGSGSAAAFQGMISAKLLITVIELTNEPKRMKSYATVLPKLLAMQSEIVDRIYPHLVQLFEQDSVQFDKTIKLRKHRDVEQDPVKRSQLSRQALQELKIAVDIPLEIAKLSVELARFGEFVFDNGFQSARGDSQVALSGSVAAVAGCISIMQLNLSLFGSNDYQWIVDKKSKCDGLRKEYDDLIPASSAKMDVLARLVESKAAFYKELEELLNSPKSTTHLTDTYLEGFARNFQNLIWRNRGIIWGQETNISPYFVMTPSTILKKILGYSFDSKTDLGGSSGSGDMDTAGIIDQSNKVVRISSHLPGSIQNFTAAHELGHALLHDQKVLHRDIPIDGFDKFDKKLKVEIEADRFASYFLMPSRQVVKRFKQLFGTTVFELNSDTTFNLTGTSRRDLRKECKNLLGLCRLLASAKTYGGTRITTLAEYFRVSDKAMAIRLAELGLVKY